jgi:hypothetical protein
LKRQKKREKSSNQERKILQYLDYSEIICIFAARKEDIPPAEMKE